MREKRTKKKTVRFKNKNKKEEKKIQKTQRE
jgi:hypothetical protein